MKNIISIALVSLCVTSSASIITNQKRPKTEKPKATPSEEQKNQNSGTSSVLSTPTTTNDSIAKTTSTSAGVTNGDTAQLLTEIYKVGVGDILDVRFMNSANAGRSTLFTVVAGGMIDFPVAGGPIMVAGLTADEIQARMPAS